MCLCVYDCCHYTFLSSFKHQNSHLAFWKLFFSFPKWLTSPCGSSSCSSLPKSWWCWHKLQEREALPPLLPSLALLLPWLKSIVEPEECAYLAEIYLVMCKFQDSDLFTNWIILLVHEPVIQWLARGCCVLWECLENSRVYERRTVESMSGETI